MSAPQRSARPQRTAAARKPARLNDDDDEDARVNAGKGGRDGQAEDEAGDNVENADDDDAEDEEDADGGDDDDDDDEMLNWAEGRRRQRAASAGRRHKKRVRRDTTVRVADAGARLTAAAVCSLDSVAQARGQMDGKNST